MIGAGPLDTSNGVGQEFVVRFATSLKPDNASFFTDSNGGDMMQRWVNYHPTYPVQLFEPIASNFYPTSSVAMLLVCTDFF